MKQPARKSTTIRVSLEKTARARLADRAKRAGLSVPAYAAVVLRHYVDGIESFYLAVEKRREG